MPTDQFENLAAKLTTFAQGVLADLRAKELETASFLHAAEVKVGFAVIKPHVAPLVESLLDRVYQEFGKLSVSDLMSELNARKAERP